MRHPKTYLPFFLVRETGTIYMRFNRIHITGASGSGTTTLGRALGQKLQYPLLDADHYFWLPTTPPFQQKRDRAERLSLILRDYHAQPSCIVSGSIVDWNETLEQSFDLIIYLWIPAEIRLARLRRREIERHGRIDEKFIAWAASYDAGDATIRSRLLHEKWLTKMRCPVFRMEDDLTVEERLDQTLAFMAV
jgi:adenylate kinase family enzyme